MNKLRLFPKIPGWEQVTERWIINVLRKDKSIAYAEGASKDCTRVELGFARGLAENVKPNAIRLILMLSPKQQTAILKRLWEKWAVYLAPRYLGK